MNNDKPVFKRWTDDEEAQLLKEFKMNSIDEIAFIHGRSKKAIDMRLQDIAIRMIKKGISPDEVYSATGKNQTDIDNRLNEIERSTPNNLTFNDIGKIIEVINNVINIVKEIESKQDIIMKMLNKE